MERRLGIEDDAKMVDEKAFDEEGVEGSRSEVAREWSAAIWRKNRERLGMTSLWCRATAESVPRTSSGAQGTARHRASKKSASWERKWW